MSGSELAAVLIALGGLITAIFVGVRGLRSDKTKGDVDKAAQLLVGYDSMIERLQTEVERLETARAHDRELCKQELADLREEHKAEMLLAYEQIDELGAQVYVLQNKPKEAT